MEQLDLLKLKHNVDMLRIQFNANKAASETVLFSSSEYAEGMKQGYKQANDNYDQYISRIEKLLEGVNIYE